MKDSVWKPTRKELHRQLDIILAKASQNVRNTVRFVITSAYRLTLKAQKS